MKCAYAPACGMAYDSVPGMKDHLIDAHHLDDTNASVIAARLYMGLPITITPTGVEPRARVLAPDPAPGLTRVEPEPKPAAKLIAPPTTPERQARAPRQKENPMPARTQTKTKCGGCGAPGRRRDSCPTCNSRGTVSVKKKAAKPASREINIPVTRRAGSKPPKDLGLPSFTAAIGFLDTQIEAAEQRLTKMRAAREGLAMLNGTDH